MHTKLQKLIRVERKITTKILELLQLVSDKKLYLKWGYSNLFDYLTRGLGYSEAVAYQRQAALRVIKEVPEVKLQLEQGSLSFSSVTKAYKALKDKPLAVKKKIINEIQNKSAREVEKYLAKENPSIALVSKKQYINSKTIRVTMDFTESEYDSIQKLRALKSHAVASDKDLFLALTQESLSKYQKINFKTPKSKNPRQISESLRRFLLKKANYKCQYPGCNQSHYLQIDHIHPVRWGGGSKQENLQVLCASHNQFKG